MKKFLPLFLLLFLLGCSTIHIPTYLPNSNPYTKRYYVDHKKMVVATVAALEDLGWKITQQIDPVVYERSSARELDADQVLLVTEVRDTPLFLGARYAKLNIYVRSKNNESEVEIRYLTINSLFVKEFSTYKNDSAAARIHSRIEKELNPE